MRKKSGRGNHRKFSIIPRVMRRKRLPDETDWIVLEADATQSSFVKRPRRFRYVWPVRIAAVAALGFSVPMALEWANEEIFYENEEFVLRQLSVQTDGVLSQGKLREVANVSAGMNLMEIDLSELRARLEKLPIVQEAIVAREMPDRINVSVIERQPVAWLSCPPLGIRPGDMERGFLMDEEGIYFRCMNLTKSVQTLPVIEVYRMDDPVEGEVMDVVGTKSALELISKQGTVPGTEDLLIHAVKLRNEWSMQCMYRSGMTATFALRGVERGLRDLAVIVQQATHMEAPLATVNLAVERNIPVTFSQPIDPAAVSSISDSLQKAAESGVSSAEDMQEKHLRSILKSG